MTNNPHRAGEKKKRTRIVVITAGISLSFIAIIILLVYTLYISSFDSFLINMAGRERMLSQKMSKELLLYKTDKTVRRSIENSIYLFESTLLSIRNGGEVFADLILAQKRYIPATRDPVLLSELDETIGLWNNFKVSIDSYLSSNSQDDLEEVMLLNPLLLERLDSVTAILQEAAEWRNQLYGFLIAFFVAAIILMLLVFLGNRVHELRKATHMIERLETILPICANCKRIREKSNGKEDAEVWITIEDYISSKESTRFTHGICPDCAKKLYPDLM